jgi:serine/threonine protein phosphatase PrpC|mmetsp:Transcript_80577/g.125542  ORF Transcript_80577/g.125542 Transcript_80577/m.125542 type:complete len:373 (-) Transcript_80577:65-1183(-)
MNANPQIDAQRRRLTVGRNDPSLPGATGANTIKLDKDEISTMFPDDQVVVVCTKTDSERQRKRSFADKDFEAFGCGIDLPEAPKAFIRSDFFTSFTCRKGMKPESPNQDSYVMVLNKGKWSLWGVFDGHGPSGHDASDFATKALVQTFLQYEDFAKNTEAAFYEAFTMCQKAIEEHGQSKNFQTSGSTCTMAFHNIVTDQLTIAYAGDSRAVLYDCTQGKLVHETEDHKPNLPKEKERIEARGGRVVFDGYYNYRVFAKAGMYPGLNMSRALGDIVAHKEAGLTAEPQNITIDLSKLRKEGSNELLLLICSDGVWEFIESGSGAQEFKGSKSLKDVDFEKQAEALAKSSWDKWMADSDNEISDDITVLAVAI